MIFQIVVNTVCTTGRTADSTAVMVVARNCTPVLIAGSTVETMKLKISWTIGKTFV